MLKVIGQPWCGESVRIVKLGHLGLVEVSYNPVHVILIMIIVIITIIIQIMIIIIIIQIMIIIMVEVPHNPVHVILREEFPSPKTIPTGFSALLLPFPAMCSLVRACNLLKIFEHLSFRSGF